MSRSRLAWFLVRAAISLALLYWLSHSGILDWRRIADLRGAPGAVALALALLAGAVVATALRLSVLAMPLRVGVPVGASLRLLLIGSAFNVFMPGAAGGDVARLYLLLRDQKGRRTELATLLIFDRVVGLVALVLFPLVMALAFPGIARAHPVLLEILQWTAGVALLTAVAAVAVWGPIGRAWVARRWPSLPLDGVIGRAAAALRIYRTAPGAVTAALALSLVASGLSFLVVVVLARAIGVTGSTPTLLVLLPLGFLTNALPLTPGGLGVGEVAMDRLFSLAGMTGGAAALIAWRVVSLVPAAFGLLLYLQGRAEYLSPAPVSPRPDATQ